MNINIHFSTVIGYILGIINMCVFMYLTSKEVASNAFIGASCGALTAVLVVAIYTFITDWFK